MSLTWKFNESHLQLHWDEVNLKSVISGFVTKLLLCKRNFGGGEFSQFPNLSGATRKDKGILSYCEHLVALHSDFHKWFYVILKMNIPDGISDPLSGANAEESTHLQEELVEVTRNDKFPFESGYQQF